MTALSNRPVTSASSASGEKQGCHSFPTAQRTALQAPAGRTRRMARGCAALTLALLLPLCPWAHGKSPSPLSSAASFPLLLLAPCQGVAPLCCEAGWLGRVLGATMSLPLLPGFCLTPALLATQPPGTGLWTPGSRDGHWAAGSGSPSPFQHRLGTLHPCSASGTAPAPLQTPIRPLTLRTLNRAETTPALVSASALRPAPLSPLLAQCPLRPLLLPPSSPPRDTLGQAGQESLISGGLTRVSLAAISLVTQTGNSFSPSPTAASGTGACPGTRRQSPRGDLPRVLQAGSGRAGKGAPRGFLLRTRALHPGRGARRCGRGRGPGATGEPGAGKAICGQGGGWHVHPSHGAPRGTAAPWSRQLRAATALPRPPGKKRATHSTENFPGSPLAFPRQRISKGHCSPASQGNFPISHSHQPRPGLARRPREPSLRPGEPASPHRVVCSSPQPSHWQPRPRCVSWHRPCSMCCTGSPRRTRPATPCTTWNTGCK